MKQVFLDHADLDCNSDWQGNGRVSVTRAESFYTQKCIFRHSIANQNILDFVRISFDANYIIHKMHIFIFSSLSVTLIKSVQNSLENTQYWYPLLLKKNAIKFSTKGSKQKSVFNRMYHGYFCSQKCNSIQLNAILNTMNHLLFNKITWQKLTQ